MRRAIRVTSLLLWFLLAGPLPAFANESPAPTAMLSLLMILPVAILGLRLAGAKLPPRGKAKRILLGLALAFSVLISMAGSGGGFLTLGALVVLLCYGVLRGGQAMKHGQGGKRFAVGLTVMVLTLLAVADYSASASFEPAYIHSSGILEGHAVRWIRTIVTNEIDFFQKAATLDANKNGVGEFGTLEQLVKAGLLPDTYNPFYGYRFAVVVSDDPARAEKEFFVYARPENYGYYSEPSPLLPGYSLWGLVRGRRLRARRTFASDETGVIRAADLGTSRAVTREEAQKWNPLN